MKKEELKFDFAQVPLTYRIIDTVKGLFNKKGSTKKFGQEFDKVVYFKKEKYNSNICQDAFIVFYTDNSVVCPNLNPDQVKRVKDAEKGYIASRSRYDEKTGMWKNEYTVVSLDRAHSLPCEINLELLVENNFVLPLQN